MLDLHTMLSNRDQRKAKTRKDIKDAALAIASSEGWNKVTIRKIADRILYTPPVVYEHFESKNDLFNILVRDGFEELYKETLRRASPDLSPDIRLTELATARFEFARENPTLHNMMFDPNNPEWGKKEILKAMDGIKNLVFECISQICGDSKKVHEYMLNLVALIYGFTFLSKHLCTEDMEHHPLGGLKEDELSKIYLNSITRFIKSIKTDNE